MGLATITSAPTVLDTRVEIVPVFVQVNQMALNHNVMLFVINFVRHHWHELIPLLHELISTVGNCHYRIISGYVCVLVNLLHTYILV